MPKRIFSRHHRFSGFVLLYTMAKIAFSKDISVQTKEIVRKVEQQN